MKITDITVNQLKSFLPKEATPFAGAGGRLIVRVFTDEGIVGIAEGSRNLSVYRAYVEDLIKPLLVGLDLLATQAHLGTTRAGQRGSMQRGSRLKLWGPSTSAAGTFWARRPVSLCTHCSAASNGATFPLYWSRGNGWKKAPGAMLQEVQEVRKGIPSLQGGMDWRDYRQDGNPLKDFALFRTCREWLPDDVPLGFDANNGYSVSTAIEQGRRLESLGVAHFEEPLPQHDLRGLRQVVDALDCAVSTGEQETSSWRFRDLMDLANPDILQPDILNVGGLTEMLRVYDMAVASNKVIMPHSPNVGVNSAASLHAYGTVTNAVRPHEFSEEFTGPAERVAELFVDPVIPENGVIKLTDRPGFGLEFDEKALEKAVVA